ncbi:replication factor C 5 [Capsaspora owczarzaki ATCC 30864]|uniref:Replication factor C 5 n=1 Tax=Capsaspora owczarzaki (strain ATCC 30864) TaxID=595528 RepID=A0A0D2WI65_CAPO3|nr:replication factor C 5 [Capsaspora owczarzaki ATCC 30864]KJE89505.1 replication factor C 5 [Capsaspora owczarzaki ATCC 30864]|eukprot:XP_004365833.1 replication factor C 5 [Capsaspora owczarzaki ATCC 30864]
MDESEPMDETPAVAEPSRVRGAASTNKNLPWVEKYRPSSLDELISHKDIISTIDRFITEDRVPHLLFYGPPGTGKTSTILACAKKMYGNRMQSMVLELNASDDRGIGVVREQIKEFASTRTITSSGGTKLVILDEADAMTSDAQAALRRVIEKYTRNTRFCLICNYVSKITPAIQSRCTRFRFAPLSSEQMLDRLNFVIESERVNVTDDGKAALMRLAQGDMRKVLNILQSTAMAFDTVDETSVYTCTGFPLPADIETIVQWLLNEPFTSAMANIGELKLQKGLALQDILREVHEFMARIEFPANVRIYLLKQLADIEYRLSAGTNERIQLGSLVAVFNTGRDMGTTA